MILKYPFLSEIYNKKSDSNIICVIQSISKNYISFYDVNMLEKPDREPFAKLAEQWWKNEPSLPVSLYYGEKFKQYDYCKRYLESNSYIILKGFQGIKLKNLSEKRIKRKIIHLD